MKVAELKQEAGKISNLDLQRKVVRVFYYLCVVTLQYTAPMILILYLKESRDEFQMQVDTEDMDKWKKAGVRVRILGNLTAGGGESD